MTLKKTTTSILKMNKPCPAKRTKHKALPFSSSSMKNGAFAIRRSGLHCHSLPSSLSQLPTSSNSVFNPNSNNKNATFAGVDNFSSEPTLDQWLEHLNKAANIADGDEERSIAVITASGSARSLATTSSSLSLSTSARHSNINNRNVRFEALKNVTAAPSSQVDSITKRRRFARRNSFVVRNLAQRAQIAEQTSIATGIWEL